MDDNYKQTLALCTAVLVLKNAVNHLLAVRCRLATHKMNQDITPEAEPSNWHIPQIFPLFYYSMGCNVGPFRGQNDLARFASMEVNASQNETYFLVLALAWPQLVSSALPDWAPTAVLVFMYSRLLHFVLYCFFQVQPWRAFAWMAGLVTNIVIAVHLLQNYK